MSIDVYVRDWHANITGNLRAFFTWALHGAVIAEPFRRSDSRDAIFGKRPIDGLGALHDMPVDRALALVSDALTRVRGADSAWLERFNAPNGWGTWTGGLNFLDELYLALLAADKQKCPHCGKCVERVQVSM